MPDLATIEDLEARLGRDLTDAEAAKAPAMLADASALLRDYCRRDFTSNTNEIIELRPVGDTLKLPNRPVLTVDQVEQIGTAGTPDRVMTAGEWEFDGIDRITVHTWCPPATTGVLGSYAGTYRVQYDSGGTVPPFIVSRCCKIVFRALLAPTVAEGLVQERIGQYAYQYGQAPGEASPGVVVELTKADEKALAKAGYRTSAGTVQLRKG